MGSKARQGFKARQRHSDFPLLNAQILREDQILTKDTVLAVIGC